MPGAPSDKMRINFDRAVVLIVDNSLGLDILSNIFLGFGVRNLHRARSVAEAMKAVQTYPIDLIVMENLMPGEDVHEFVRALRRLNAGEARFTPVVLLSAHTASSRVQLARDCGANFLISKPLSTRVLIDRIMWVARETRSFLEADTYVGPDRRFHDLGAPDGMAGRRKDDSRLKAGVDAPDAPGGPSVAGKEGGA